MLLHERLQRSQAEAHRSGVTFGGCQREAVSQTPRVRDTMRHDTSCRFAPQQHVKACRGRRILGKSAGCRAAPPGRSSAIRGVLRADKDTTPAATLAAALRRRPSSADICRAWKARQRRSAYRERCMTRESKHTHRRLHSPAGAAPFLLEVAFLLDVCPMAREETQPVRGPHGAIGLDGASTRRGW